jgi:hypothetical protein
MTDTSISVQHSTTVQHPSTNNRSDEDWEIIPARRTNDSIVHENNSESDAIRYISSVLNFFIIIHILSSLDKI